MSSAYLREKAIGKKIREQREEVEVSAKLYAKLLKTVSVQDDVSKSGLCIKKSA
jgi:hypothetical protein